MVYWDILLWWNLRNMFQIACTELFWSNLLLPITMLSTSHFGDDDFCDFLDALYIPRLSHVSHWFQTSAFIQKRCLSTSRHRTIFSRHGTKQKQECTSHHQLPNAPAQKVIRPIEIILSHFSEKWFFAPTQTKTSVKWISESISEWVSDN